jgi:serine/threonine-protein kinase SRPK3
MQRALLRAAEKKMKFQNNKKKNIDNESNSEGSLTSDDEEEVSKDIVGKIYNGKYIVLKYLGRGTFSRVWMVYNLEDSNFYAMKVIFEKYFEDTSHEISINKLIGNQNNNLAKTIDIFGNEDNKKEVCFITELLGICVLDLFNKFKDKDPPRELIKKVTKGILLGLKELHEKDIVHTDLKQENVMIDIYTEKIKNLKNYINSLKLSDTLEELVQAELPEDYSNFDKQKKKKIKRKCRLKAYKKYKMYIYENIVKFNNDSKKEMEVIEIDDVSDLEEEETYFEIDPEYNFNVKIIDFGNAEHLDKLEQDEIQIRPYRPPENIINDYYDLKSDIWTLGCLLFEILTGDYLFDIDRCNKSIERDRLHIHSMYEILGKMPREMAEMCDFSEDLFDNKGRVLKHKNCNYTSLSEILITEFEFEKSDAIEIERFLKRMLEYDPKKRASAKELLEDPWIK